jgi:uncharacterized membrane protein
VIHRFAARVSLERTRIPLTETSRDLPSDPSRPQRFPTARLVMRWLATAFFLFAGAGHLMIPDKLLAITPDWVPFPREVLLVTGVAEIAGSVALVAIPRLRWLVGILFALYAVCVFPANVKHAIDGIHLPPIPDSWWYHGPRLAFQPVIVWWSLFATGVIDWPWRKRIVTPAKTLDDAE